MEPKYFKPNEIISLKPELVYLLDEARGFAGIPFIITSGYRTEEHNKEVGGVANSSHLTGDAADLRCGNSAERMKIVAGLIAAGAPRIGIAKDHVHVDVDETKAKGVIFLEYA